MRTKKGRFRVPRGANTPDQLSMKVVAMRDGAAEWFAIAKGPRPRISRKISNDCAGQANDFTDRATAVVLRHVLGFGKTVGDDGCDDEHATMFEQARRDKLPCATADQICCRTSTQYGSFSTICALRTCLSILLRRRSATVVSVASARGPSLRTSSAFSWRVAPRTSRWRSARASHRVIRSYRA